MRLQILVCARTRIAKHVRAGQHAAVLLVRALRVQHAQTLRRHAIDAPVDVPMVVADRDREAAVVGAYQIDQVARVAFDRQRFALARVRRLVLGRACAAAAAQRQTAAGGERTGTAGRCGRRGGCCGCTFDRRTREWIVG